MRFVMGAAAPRSGARRHQAACDNTGNGTMRAVWASSSRREAISRQLPQLAPAPVRMVSSATLRQPASAVSRIWRSVTPWQMQTYKGGSGKRCRSCPDSVLPNENDCQFAPRHPLAGSSLSVTRLIRRSEFPLQPIRARGPGSAAAAENPCPAPAPRAAARIQDPKAPEWPIGRPTGGRTVQGAAGPRRRRRA